MTTPDTQKALEALIGEALAFASNDQTWRPSREDVAEWSQRFAALSQDRESKAAASAGEELIATTIDVLDWMHKRLSEETTFTSPRAQQLAVLLLRWKATLAAHQDEAPPPMGFEPVAWLYEHFMPLQGKPVNVCAQIERANMAENLSPWGRPGYDFGGTVTETPLYTSPMGGEPLREVLLQSRLYVEAASTYKGPDVHSVGDQEIREEANRLLSEIDAALAAAPMRGEPASAAIFLVATGEVHEGKETYTRHEGRPPPLCDFEGPLSTSPKGGAAEGLVLVPKEPTPEMNRAGFYAHQATGLTGEIWRAMLAAAPQEWSQP
jgi:hypothetical protein